MSRSLPLSHCPVCSHNSFQTLATEQDIAQQVQWRDEFVYARTERRQNASELKDLTDLMHGFPAPLLTCTHCGLTIRAEQQQRGAQSYEEDPNDLDLMRQLRPRYTQAFRNKGAAYQPLLRPHAEVLEIAPHLGGFLQAAAEWSWNPIGLDIGQDVISFLKPEGFRVHYGVIEEAHLPEHSFDAVFVWNCFDQLEHPGTTLSAIHRVLKPHGLLVLRVPNIALFTALLPRMRQGTLSRRELQVLAYNNLLTFPYLFGYDEHSLVRLASRWGFAPLEGFNTELLTMPFPVLTEQIESEENAVTEAAVDNQVETNGQLNGPWIEVVFLRRDESELPDRSSKHQYPRHVPRFLPRAA